MYSFEGVKNHNIIKVVVVYIYFIFNINNNNFSIKFRDKI